MDSREDSIADADAGTFRYNNKQDGLSGCVERLPLKTQNFAATLEQLTAVAKAFYFH